MVSAVVLLSSAGSESSGAPWPGGNVSGDALRAAIAVTVTGQRLDKGGDTCRDRDRSNLL